jgi:glycosyl transferase family 25
MARGVHRFREMFPHRVCINLDRRPERWQRMQARFAKVDLGSVERFPAVDGAKLQVPAHWPESAGAYGCLQSHLAVVRQARAQGRENVLIIEDDVLFAEDFHEEFERRVPGLPADWDMLFFGCLHHDPPAPAAPGIGRLRASFSTLMYAVRRTVYDAFIFVNEREECAVDRSNWKLQERFNCYCFMPHLAWVDDSYSDAQGVLSNHWYIRDSMVLRGEEMKSMEKRTAVIIPYRENGNRERGLKNLSFLTRHYGALFAVLIVEQNNRPCLNASVAPPGCDYVHVPEARQEDCYAAGLEKFGHTKDFFIINDGNVFCSRMEMRASLSKCVEHDAVGSFATFIDLDDADSDRLLSGREYHTESYSPRARRGRFREYFTVTKKGLRELCAFTTFADDDGQASPGADLRTFDSPGSALCLSAGQSGPQQFRHGNNTNCD